MPSYTVTSLERTKSWDGKYGPMVDYIVTLRDEAGQETASVTVAQKAATAAVTVGQTLTGTIGQGKWGPKFEKEQQQGGGGGHYRPRDPAEIAAIQRQHSQEMALRYAQIRAMQGELPTDFKLSDLKVIVDWFQLDIEDSPAKYGGVVKEPQRTGQSDLPNDAPVHPPADAADVPWKQGAMA